MRQGQAPKAAAPEPNCTPGAHLLAPNKSTIPYVGHPLPPDKISSIYHGRKTRVRRTSTAPIVNNRARHRNSIRKLAENTLDLRKYITNLSSKSLSADEVAVLAKGLKYVPTGQLDKSNLENSVDNFERLNRIRHFFRNYPDTEPHPFRQKSAWVPPRASPHIEAYLERVRAQTLSLESKPFRHNLSYQERQTLHKLASDDNIVIKSADKGSGIVVEDRDRYIRDGLEHLSDASIYEQINSDPTATLTEAINQYINNMYNKGIVDNITKSYLLAQENKETRTQQLYFLKKIHKNPIAVRPIVSGCGGPTERISSLVDLHLQPHVPLANSYLRDSSQLLQLLEDRTFPTDVTLATIDVKALYLNIPHGEGTRAVLNRLYHNNPNSQAVEMPPETMADLLKIVLTHNYFHFADRMYHQVQGTAMGTKTAPAYANLFMAELEESILENTTTTPLLWKRYIDDILCIWPGSPESLETFVDQINSMHPTIKFTYECSRESVDFLDITIYKGNRFAHTNKLDVKPFFKKTNKFQYLEYSSAHPRRTFSSLVKGEMIRLLRACSQEATYKSVQHKMELIFRDRGYPKAIIAQATASVPFSSRQQRLLDKKPTDNGYDTYLVAEYTPDLDVPKLNHILRPTEDEATQVAKPCLSLKKPKNIANKLVRAKLPHCQAPPKSHTQITITTTPNLDGHSAGCATPGCKCCRAMSRKVRIISNTNHKSFPTPKHTNCDTKCVIYLLECTKCSKGNQYIGQTGRTTSERLAGHRAASKVKINLPIYKHFAVKTDHNFERDTRLTILEKTTKALLDSRESHWISTMETVYPKGLNSRYE